MSDMSHMTRPPSLQGRSGLRDVRYFTNCMPKIFFVIGIYRMGCLKNHSRATKTSRHLACHCLNGLVCGISFLDKKMVDVMERNVIEITKADLQRMRGSPPNDRRARFLKEVITISSFVLVQILCLYHILERANSYFMLAQIVGLCLRISIFIKKLE